MEVQELHELFLKEITQCDETIAEFGTRLVDGLEDPSRVFGDAETTVHQVARRTVLRYLAEAAVRAMTTINPPVEFLAPGEFHAWVLSFAEHRVLNGAAYPSHSSSAMQKLIDDHSTAAWTTVISLMKRLK